MSDHITTYSGIKFTPQDPNPAQINIKDIAHSLSLMCRGNGHIIHFYSVAQHCINCAKEAKARNFSPRVQLACLLHDASESYLSDITRPVKKHLPMYIEIEENLQNMIYSHFLGLPLTKEECQKVKQIDDDMLVCEFKDLMNRDVFDCQIAVVSKPNLDFINFSDIEKEFLQIFNDLWESEPCSKQ